MFVALKFLLGHERIKVFLYDRGKLIIANFSDLYSWFSFSILVLRPVVLFLGPTLVISVAVISVVILASTTVVAALVILLLIPLSSTIAIVLIPIAVSSIVIIVTITSLIVMRWPMVKLVLLLLILVLDFLTHLFNLFGTSLIFLDVAGPSIILIAKHIRNQH